jgi:hypothetical protein
VQELLAQLVHDVGKYLARTARNLPAAESIDAGLIAMLCRDLYGDPGKPSPAARFTALSAELQPLLPAAPLPAIAAMFNELTDLAVAVRAGQPAAVTRATTLALQVEQQLRALATPSPRPPKPRAR